MGIRIQPREIDIPEDEPFKNDLLERRGVVEVLTPLLGNVVGPCVLAIDAPWGTGKSTFLRMWSQYLRNRGFPVVEFNAWETDFSEDPFVAVSAEITNQLHDETDTSLSQKIRATKKVATKMALRAVPGLIRVATAGVLDVSLLVEKEVGEFLASAAKDRLSQYQEMRQSVEEFKISLYDLAVTAAGSSGGRPLVVIIDELDRCRPSYAVELLEVAKHLFSVDRIVFVLAINRSELAHSIKAIYGRDFDSEGYLRRFFDVDFKLPEPNRDTFIKATLDATELTSYFQQASGQGVTNGDEWGKVQTLLMHFFASPDLSLRRIAQAIHRLGLVFASSPDSRQVFGPAAVVAVILRTFSEELYNQFILGQVSDLEVAEQMLGNFVHGADAQRDWAAMLLEETIVLAAREITNKRWGTDRGWQLKLSPLLNQCKKLIDDANSQGRAYSSDEQFASEVYQYVVRFVQRHGQGAIGFLDSVHRLELLATDLTEE